MLNPNTNTTINNPLYDHVSFNFVNVKMATDLEVSSIFGKQKSKRGKPLNSIRKDINKRESVGSGKFSAFCKYCKITWKRGEVSKLEKHLSNHCKNASATIVRKYMSKILERQDKVTKKENFQVVNNIWTIITI
ncbi:hypothetical protein RhiirA5_507915 [Rhizophagus irregularis]|uniref:BED-type domain-containing protein n=1 Tax=Rhizophagus irregularis TaxID=588596 RepID=A0A2N0NGA3_9GLOM|nr:hypothetical protein RhiirA5_507915 [Rhizophagus irregularis]